jgi:NADH-quinone oxidoreductase subunit M
LLGVIALVVVHYQYGAGGLTFSIPELTRGLATVGARWPDWAKADSWTSPQVLIFLLLFAGFAIKVPMFPFHTWLPLAHVEAPTAGSILLAGVLLKVGSYGLLRFNMAMTPVGARFLFPLLAALAVVGILYGALAALAQSDVKRLIAYSSVSHMGFVVLGLFAMNTTAMNGAAAQMINHGLTTGALFACVGVIYERYHTREMGEMSGLWKRLPVFTFFFILSCLGSAALPGLNGFVGEFPILVGAFARDRPSAVLASLGMILGAYYLLWMLQRVVFGPLHEPHGHEVHDLGGVEPPEHPPTGHAEPDSRHGHVRPIGWHEVAGLTPLMVFIVLIGVLPDMVFNDTRPTIAEIALPYQRMDERETEQNRPRVGLRRSVAPADAVAGPLTQVESKGRR